MNNFLRIMYICFRFVKKPITIYGYTFSVYTVLLFILIFCLCLLIISIFYKS